MIKDRIKKDKIKFAVSTVKYGIDVATAEAAAIQAKKELEQYYENVHFGTHMDAIEQAKDFNKKISIKRLNEYLVLCIDDEVIPGQKNLVVSSAVNDATTVSIEFIMTKDVMPICEIEV